MTHGHQGEEIQRLRVVIDSYAQSSAAAAKEIRELQGQVAKLESLTRFQDRVIRSGNTACLTQAERASVVRAIETLEGVEYLEAFSTENDATAAATLRGLLERLGVTQPRPSDATGRGSVTPTDAEREKDTDWFFDWPTGYVRYRNGRREALQDRGNSPPRLLLTDAEREAVRFCVTASLPETEKLGGVAGELCRMHAATLRGLLERMQGVSGDDSLLCELRKFRRQQEAMLREKGLGSEPD